MLSKPVVSTDVVMGKDGAKMPLEVTVIVTSPAIVALRVHAMPRIEYNDLVQDGQLEEEKESSAPNQEPACPGQPKVVEEDERNLATSARSGPGKGGGRKSSDLTEAEQPAL